MAVSQAVRLPKAFRFEAREVRSARSATRWCWSDREEAVRRQPLGARCFEEYRDIPHGRMGANRHHCRLSKFGSERIMSATAQTIHAWPQPGRPPAQEFRFEGHEVLVSKVGDKVILEPLTKQPSMRRRAFARLDELGRARFSPRRYS